MSGISLATKGMICNGNGASSGGGLPVLSTPVAEMPVINVVRIKTKILKPGISLKELSTIVFNVDKVLSSY